MCNEKEIYILLTDTGTVLTKIIKLFTRDPLNHASIAFDSDLEEVYSFGRKNPNNPFLAGFVKEEVRGSFFEDSMCAVYRCKLSQTAYQNIKLQIQHFEQHQHLYKYNLIGMLGVLFNVEMKRKYSYFCSQFVATVFERSGIRLVSKSPLLVTPGDLQTTPLLELVYYGKLHAYAGCQPIQPAASTFQTA